MTPGGEAETRKFFNTHKILMLAITPGKYEITYGVWEAPEKPKNESELLYSQIITIGCGFGLMFLAFCFFEGRNLFRWIRKKLRNCRGKSQEKIELEPVDTEGSEID